MGRIVFWQISLYVVLCVLYVTLLEWWCSASVDAYTVEDQFNADSSTSSIANTSIIPTSRPSNAINETQFGQMSSKRTNNNDDDSLEEQLKDDQMALKRMVTILSLVGVIGAMALVATIVIFTKMRRRKQKINSKLSNSAGDDDDNDNDDGSTSDQQHGSSTRSHERRRYSSDTSSHRSLGNASNRSLERETPALNDGNILDMPVSPTVPSSIDSNTSIQIRLPDTDIMNPQPSAPPSTFPFTPSMSTTLDHRRHTLSIPLPLQQSSSPTPSAPTAKELDHHQHQEHLGNATDDLHPQYSQQGHYYHREPTSTMNTTMVTTPDQPPPAYTLYDRTCQSASITNTATQLTSLRRHSQI